jgi:hypothetical protein
LRDHIQKRVGQGRFPRRSTPGNQDIAALRDRMAQKNRLLGRHNARADIVLEREYRRSRFPNRERWRGNNRGNQSLETLTRGSRLPARHLRIGAIGTFVAHDMAVFLAKRQ